MARSGVGVWCAGHLEPSLGRPLGAGILWGSGPVSFAEAPGQKEIDDPIHGPQRAGGQRFLPR
jgi:hypothetical protein